MSEVTHFYGDDCNPPHEVGDGLERLHKENFDTKEHMVEIVSPGFIREVIAECSCGWKSGWVPNRQAAAESWDNHVKEMRRGWTK